MYVSYVLLGWLNFLLLFSVFNILLLLAATTDQTKVVDLIQEAANIIQSHSCVTWKVRDSEQYYVRIQNGGG